MRRLVRLPARPCRRSDPNSLSSRPLGAYFFGFENGTRHGRPWTTVAQEETLAESDRARVLIGEKPHEIERQDSASHRRTAGNLGAAIAVALAEEGADVALTWIDDEPAAERVAACIRQVGRRVHLIHADVARLAAIHMMVTDTSRMLGAPDILVNNAGVYPRVKLLEMRESDWDYVLDINLKAGCFATIAFVKALMSAGKDRRVGDQHLLAGDPRCRTWRALQREQGLCGLDNSRHGARARPAQHPRQRHRARHDRNRPAAVWQPRYRADRDGARPFRSAARCWRPIRSHEPSFSSLPRMPMPLLARSCTSTAARTCREAPDRYTTLKRGKRPQLGWELV